MTYGLFDRYVLADFNFFKVMSVTMLCSSDVFYCIYLSSSLSRLSLFLTLSRNKVVISIAYIRRGLQVADNAVVVFSFGFVFVSYFRV